MPREFIKSLRPNALKLFLLSFFAVCVAAGFGAQTAFAASENAPSAYAAVDKDGGTSITGTQIYCDFKSSASIFCSRDDTFTEASNDGREGEKTYWFDPELSASAGHDVFRPDDGAKTSEYGWLHFPNSVSGDYSLVVISTLPIANSKTITADQGVSDDDVGGQDKHDTPPDDSGICNIEMFAKGDKALSCDVGDDPIKSVSGVTYKSGFDSYVEVKKCDKGGLGFVLCPIQEMMIDVVSQLNEWLANLLDINTEGFQNETLKEASQNILNLTNAIYAIIFLVIIFANGLSIGIDSYALKKMVPRLVAAIILSQFAFFITGAFIEIGNILGRGITAFFASIVPETANRAGAGGALALGVLTAGAVLVAISMLVIVIIALLVVLAVLAIRWAILYALILVAPLAFAAHVLPNTDKLWKLWWTNLVKLVMMFPIIMAITSGAAFLGAIMVNSDSPGAIQVVGALLPFIGFLLIPKAFKWSGNIMAATGGKVAEYGTKRAKSSAKEGAQAKLTNKGIETGLKIPVLGKAVGNSKTLGTAIHKNMGQREKRIDSKQGLDSVSGSRLEKMAAAGHKGAKDEIQKKYSEELDKQETRARQGLSVDATKLVKLRTVLGGSEGSVEQTNRANLEASRLGNAAQQYVNDAPPGAAPREMPEIRYNKPGEKAPANAPAGTPDPQRNYFGGTPIVQPATPGTPPPRNPANPLQPPPPHGGHM